MHVRDPSGVTIAGAVFTTAGVQNDFCGQFMELVEGTARDGVWQLQCSLPAAIRNGSYEAMPYAQDAMLNWTNTNGGSRSDVRARFEVVAGVDDTEGPLVVSLDTDKAVVAPGDELVVRAHLTDPQGVDYAGVYFTVGGIQNDFCGQFMTLVSGTAEDGVWELRCTVPTTARSGSYTVTPYARDGVGNYTNTNGGSPSDVRATFGVIDGASDSTGPQVLSLTTNASSYRPGDEFVIQARLRDASGVDHAGVTFTANGVQKDFCGQFMTLVEGTAADGLWELRCVVPSTAPVGTYEAMPYARDAVNNHTNTNGGDVSDVRATFEILP